MTENEAKKWLRAISATQRESNHTSSLEVRKEALYMAIQALEEIQQYRAIGTVEGYKRAVKVSKENYYLCSEYKARLKEYEAIGTIEEFKALKEKNEPRKILYRKQSYGTPWLCPECEADQVKVEFFSEDGIEPKEKHSFCWKCGTKIDWSE